MLPSFVILPFLEILLNRSLLARYCLDVCYPISLVACILTSVLADIDHGEWKRTHVYSTPPGVLDGYQLRRRA